MFGLFSSTFTMCCFVEDKYHKINTERTAPVIKAP